MNKRRRGTIAFAFTLCAIATATAYDAGALENDAAAFLDGQNAMRRDLAAPWAALRKSQPHMTAGQATSFAADLDFGLVVAPAYAYRAGIGDSGPFAALGYPDEGGGARSAAPSIGASMLLGSGLGFCFDLSALPATRIDDTESEFLRVGAGTRWRLLADRFYAVGAIIGVGATYARGADARSIGGSFDDAGTLRAFSADLESDWQYGVIDAELFIHRTFFVINFYSRATGSYVFGTARSLLRGVRVDAATVAGAAEEYSRTLSSSVLDLVLAAGTELILGELKLAAEAGRSWRSGTMYGSVGLRFGM